jgi:hypothetical protein
VLGCLQAEAMGTRADLARMKQIFIQKKNEPLNKS